MSGEADFMVLERAEGFLIAWKASVRVRGEPLYVYSSRFYPTREDAEAVISRQSPRFYSMKNLGPSGPPDHNRRFVHHWPCRGPQDDEIAVFKASDPEAGWTAKDDRALSAYLKVLNEEAD